MKDEGGAIGAVQHIGCAVDDESARVLVDPVREVVVLGVAVERDHRVHGGLSQVGYQALVLLARQVDGAAPRITIRFLPHDEYVRVAGTGTVGTTGTHFCSTSPGLISAKILIDSDSRDTPGEVRSTLIHELTHAIGCSGHFTSPSDSRRSVLYTSSQMTSWSQTDAAVIRLVYSPWIRSGMTSTQAVSSLQLYASSGN